MIKIETGADLGDVIKLINEGQKIDYEIIEIDEFDSKVLAEDLQSMATFVAKRKWRATTHGRSSQLEFPKILLKMVSTADSTLEICYQFYNDKIYKSFHRVK